MSINFTKATRSKGRARIALVGPSGSGKTLSALLIAGGLGERIAVLDTEHGTASKYANLRGQGVDVPEFDTAQLDSYSPDNYITAIQAADKAGYDVLVIDSLSHAWSGKDGLLDFVDKRAKQMQSGNTFAAWRDATPKHNQLIDAILGADLHIIATMRAKTEYLSERDERTGKMGVRKVGLQPVQRDGMEYEFDIVGDMDERHNLIVGKTRMFTIADAVIERPGAALGKQIAEWLGSDLPETKQPAGAVVSSAASRKAITSQIAGELKTLGLSDRNVMRSFTSHLLGFEVSGIDALTDAQLVELRDRLATETIENELTLWLDRQQVDTNIQPTKGADE